MVSNFENQIYTELLKISKSSPVAWKTLTFSESVRRISSGEYSHSFGCQISIFGKTLGGASDTAILDEADSALTGWVESTKQFLKKKKFQITHINSTTFKVSKS